ncbi:MAG TPA: Mur ligase domain-containing protein, partial [Thermoanaerobaculia bacterium]|nr:Mur ligase domain-containing protein [Thermoanaerobaculia bacterium]
MFNRFTDLSRIHFVGIGGAGMSGIAEILLEYDLEVSGCDLALGEATERLAEMGARIAQGHSPDHLDTYGTLEAIEEAFVEFANRVPFFGRLIVCLDDPNIQKILPRLADRRIITYGLSPQADLSAVDLEPHGGGSRFRVRWRSDRVLGRIDL